MYPYTKKKAGHGDRRHNRRCVEDATGGWMVGGLVEDLDTCPAKDELSTTGDPEQI